MELIIVIVVVVVLGVLLYKPYTKTDSSNSEPIAPYKIETPPEVQSPIVDESTTKEQKDDPPVKKTRKPRKPKDSEVTSVDTAIPKNAVVVKTSNRGRPLKNK